MRWLGKLSFSIYLLHWPILTIAQQDASAPLSLLHKLGLAGAAVAGAAIVYYLVENPLRHSRFLAKSPRLSIAMGLLVVAAILVTATYEIHSHPGFL
jgi:peptidoglycan/LPS O-acetylase OafA/YrhL